MTPQATLLPKRCFVRTLVEDGVVVMPVHNRSVPISSSSLMSGTTTRTKPVQEIVIAVEPGEVRWLDEAMALKYEITCVVRSGRPQPAAPPALTQRPSAGGWQALAAFGKAMFGAGSAADKHEIAVTPSKVSAASHTSEKPGKDQLAADITPGLDPFAQISYLELMVGHKRQFMLFNGPNGSPTPAPQSDDAAAAGPAVVPAGDVEESKE